MSSASRQPITAVDAHIECAHKPYTIVFVGGSKPKNLDTLLSKRPGLSVVQCPNQPAGELLAYCRKLTPSILLADQAVLDQLEPADLSRQIDFGRTVKVVVRLRGPESIEVIEHLLMVGCVGFLSDRSSTATVRKAILAVAAGELWVSRRILSELLQSLLQASRSNLSPREEEILRLIGVGCRNQEIATRLFISPETVRWHIRSLYSKIGVHDRLSAVMYARANRIIPPPSSLRVG